MSDAQHVVEQGSTFDPSSAAPEQEGTAGSADLEKREEDRYLLERVLGIGGMGKVIAARDGRLDREVAVKVARADLDARLRLDQRLAREAWVMARLEHPGILPVYDAGRMSDGRAFYAMPIVKGRSLAQRLREARSPAERLPLLRRVLEAAEAVGAAHRAGIVHRDLKPSNIMIGEDGGTRVIDWGLARPIDETRVHDLGDGLSGTPEYMSPEQRTHGFDDPRADVWSLGAILHEVASGKRFGGDFGRGQPGHLEPSASLGPADRRAQLSVNALELQAIIARATGPLASRYVDAAAFSEDLAHHLEGRRVSAHVYTMRELFVRFVKAARVPLTIVGVALSSVVVLVVLGMDRLRDEAERALAAETVARTAEARAKLAADEAERGRVASLLIQAQVQAERGAQAESEVAAARALASIDSPIARGAILFWSRAVRPEIVERAKVPDCLAFEVASDGERLLCRTGSALEVWHIREERRLWSTPAETSSATWWAGDVAYFTGIQRMVVLDGATGQIVDDMLIPCGQTLQARDARVATFGGDCIWVAHREMISFPVREVPCPGSFHSALALHADGDLWAATCGTGEVVIDGASHGERMRIPLGLSMPQAPMSVAFLDRERVIVGTNLGDLRIASRDGVGRAIPTGHPQVIRVLVSPAASLVVALGSSQSPTLFEVGSELIMGRLEGGVRRDIAFVGDDLIDIRHEFQRRRIGRGVLSAFSIGGGATSVTFDDRGEMIAVTHASGITARDMKFGAIAIDVKGASDGVMKAVRFSHDGQDLFLSSTSLDEVGVVTRAPHRPLSTASSTSIARRLDLLDNGWLIGVPFGPGLILGHYGDADRVEFPSHRRHRFLDMAVAGNRRDVMLTEQGTAVIWHFDLSSFSLEPRFEEPGTVAIAIGRDARLVATGGPQWIALWDALTGELMRHITLGGLTVTKVAISADERWLAAGTQDGGLRIWELASGELRAELSAHRDRVSALNFAPDGFTLASAGWDSMVRLYDLRTLDLTPALVMHRVNAAWSSTAREIFD